VTARGVGAAGIASLDDDGAPDVDEFDRRRESFVGDGEESAVGRWRDLGREVPDADRKAQRHNRTPRWCDPGRRDPGKRGRE
jgi:hypothetical protein